MLNMRHGSGTKIRKTDVVIVGAGAAGLAMSYELAQRGIDHVVLERGEIANSWRTERWDSLRLLSPNWQTRLPGKFYNGSSPDNFMAMPELIKFMEDYARGNTAPVFTGVTVTAAMAKDDGYAVVTNQAQWNCRSLVIATGAFNIPIVPKLNRFASSSTHSPLEILTSHQYKNPEQLDPGNVLVVGASATGLQLASEIQASGRRVTLAVGEHVRMPRTYRGKDIFWWMQYAGISGESLGQVDDISRVRSLPSPQLIGSHAFSIFDLNRLQQQGVQIAGRLMNANEDNLQFSGSLHNVCQLADLKMSRLLKRFDQRLEQTGRSNLFADRESFLPTRVPESPLLQMRSKEFKTIVWATGYRPDYSWLQLPVLNRKGMLEHKSGVVNSPGVYVLGLPFLRRRNSSFIQGIGEDASELSQHLHNYLSTTVSRQHVAMS